MFNSIISGAVLGLECHLISVEVDVSPGLPCFQMVGYLSSEVRESRERVRVALRNAGFALPAMCINVNLSPADMRKEGTAFDLPLAVGVLSALGDIDPEATKNTLIIGELGLNGEVRPVRGILPIVLEASKNGLKRVILPSENKSEGAVIPGIEIIPVSSLSEVYDYLNGTAIDFEINKPFPLANGNPYPENESSPDFSDVHGQALIKRAAMIAAAGFHHLLMIGPPGAGKTMIAKRIPGILPPLTTDESLEVTSIYSIAGLLDEKRPLITTRPFLSPHHTITEQALAGGGRIPRPGIISLAHRGVLFLDEMTEFSRATLDIMRQPLEEKSVYISRTHGTYKYPADFMLVAACNPCPCGYYPDMNKCHCTAPQIQKYLNRISGPLLDRIDICCDVEPVDLRKLKEDESECLNSEAVRQKVLIARQLQAHRFTDSPYNFNSEMTGKDIELLCQPSPDALCILNNAVDSLDLSARSYHRILRTARTIADLSQSEYIEGEHISEAIIYRTNGNRYWGR